jgi:hypothetical protein
MKVVKFYKIKRKENFPPPIRLEIFRQNPRRESAVRILVVLIVLLVVQPVLLYAQSTEFFNVNTIINDVQKQFKLNSKELHSLKPLVVQENEDVIQIYLRFSLKEPEYLSEIWQVLINRRVDFETRLKAKLTKRQKAALRAARTTLEERILGFLADDYAMFLGDSLELDELELEAVQLVISAEYESKHELIVKYVSRPDFLQTQLEKNDAESESKLKMIFSPRQFRDYQLLSETKKLLLG